MKIEELLLAAGESSHVDNLRGVDAHSLEGWTVSDRRDDELSVVFEANEPTIEEMINARRQQQAIFAVESLFVGRVPPRLAVTCNKVHRIFDAGDAASCFDLAHPILEQALSIPRTDNRQPIGFSDGGIVDQLLLQLAFPKIEIIC